MPRVSKKPKKTSSKEAVDKEVLKPYLFHGIDLDEDAREGSGKEALGDCPFCGSEGKFSVSLKSGLYRCLVCAEGSDKGGGNPTIFVRKLWKTFYDSSEVSDEVLRKDRGLLYPDTLTKWEVVWSTFKNCWLVPGYSLDGTIATLYRYVKLRDKGHRLLPTPSLGHKLFGSVDRTKERVYVCEGPWDAMALYEVLSNVRRNEDGGIVVCGRSKHSLLSESSVVAVPGANTFLDSWAGLFKDKTVILMFDNDWPRKNPKTGKEAVPVGYSGMKRVGGVLLGAKNPPREVFYLNWGKGGFDKDLPNGYDVRDFLGGGTIEERAEKFSELLTKVEEAPDDWIGEERKRKEREDSLETLECTEYGVLREAWEEAMTWTEGLDHALTCMLSSIISTELLGDQLWVKIIGPAACGKSTLCEAVSVAKDYVIAKSTIRGFHSGFGDGDEDHSLVSKAKGKTLVVKDGDTLLQSPNLPQILSEGRDVYDTVSRTSYRNKNSRDYEGIRMTWILCGTSSLRSIDSSELGERFLDCVIMKRIDVEMERLIVRNVVRRARRDLTMEANGRAESNNSPAMVKAMRLTGGYIEYLRENASRLLSTESIHLSEKYEDMCLDLGIFVAFMRARPSLRQKEEVERELGTRLSSVITRLACCTAAVLNKPEVDLEVMRRTRKVALDTARGPTLDLAKTLYESGKEGAELKSLSIYTNLSEKDTRAYLKFLRLIEVVEVFSVRKKGIVSKPKYRLTPYLELLYRSILIDELEKL